MYDSIVSSHQVLGDSYIYDMRRYDTMIVTSRRYW